MTEYKDTAEAIADTLGIKPKVVTDWARNGYPVHRAGENKRVKFQGSIQAGKSYRFNMRAVLNFIENMNDKKWASFDENIKQKAAYKLPKIGHVNSSSTTNDSVKRLRDLIALRKNKQSARARN